MKVAVVGATGLVGNVMLEVLAERNFPVTELIPVASEKSVGKTISFKGKEYKIVGMNQAISLKPDVALFSAGGDTSKEWAPKFAQVGTVVVDNSSAWRMDPTKKLVIPEINAEVLTAEDKIIANPNCSTIHAGSLGAFAQVWYQAYCGFHLSVYHWNRGEGRDSAGKRVQRNTRAYGLPLPYPPQCHPSL